MEYHDGEVLKDKRPCAHVRANLKMCLLKSDCCKKEKRTPKDCLGDPTSNIPIKCRELRLTFFECKRSILDMRLRFRGRRYE